MLLAYATVALAVFTAAMVYFTWKLASEARDASYREIGVQTWLEFVKRFDSPDMIRARKKLGKQLTSNPPAKYGDVSDTVPNFFEDLGIAYKHGYIVKELADSSFSMYATRYWEAVKPYVDAERRQYGDDTSISRDFEDLAKAMREPGEKIDDKQLRQFLEDERDLVTD